MDPFFQAASGVFWKGIAAVAAVISLATGVVAPLAQAPGDDNVGAALPTVVADFETSLAAAIDSTATTMTLVSGTDDAGSSLSGLYGFVINEGASNQEFVLCTASSTALSACTRGISPTTGNTAVTALQKTHRRGESVKITDHPVLAVAIRILNGQETLPNRLQYVSTTPSSSFTTYDLIDKQYADSLAISGAPVGSAGTPGIVQIATGSQLYNSLSGSPYEYVAPSGLFSGTPSSSITYQVPVTQSGTIATGFVCQSASCNYSFLGSVTIASTTVTGTTTASGLAASSVVTTDSAKALTTVPATTGNGSALSINNGVWSAGFPKTFATLTTTTVNGTMTSIGTTTLPSAATGSIYFITFDFPVPSVAATATISLGGTDIFSNCSTKGNSSNNLAGTVTVAMGNSTSSQFVSGQIYNPVGSVTTTLCGVMSRQAINMSSNPTLNFRLQIAATSSITVTTTAIMYQ